MATIRYANPGGSNTSPYDTVAKGATDPQTILDLAEVTDECRLYGTFVHGTHFTGPLTIDTNAGSVTTGFIKVVGVNAAGANDGTLAVIDGNDAGLCIQMGGKDFWWFENLDVKQSSGEGVDDGSVTMVGNVFLNCRFHDNATSGVGGYRFSYGLFILCSFYSNGSNGLALLNGGNILMFCSFHDNTGSGFVPKYNTGGVAIGCLIYDNTGYGITDLGSMLLYNCVINGNTEDGIEAYTSTYPYGRIIGNRITNHPAGKYGLDCQDCTYIHGWNYFEDNVAGHLVNDAFAEEILVAGVGTNDEDNADTNEGYTNKGDGTEDFNLTSDASMRRQAITIPLV